MERLKSNLRSLLASRFWLAALLIFVVSRLATWLFPFDSDHWIFYYVGRRWLEGDILYLQVWDHKSPLIFSINSFMHALFGNSIILHRLFLTAVALASLWLFYRTALRFFSYIGRKKILWDARVATLLFAFTGNLSQFTNSGNNTENFGILALITAYYCYLRFRQSRAAWKWLLYSGIAISFLLLLKINFVILLLPLVLDFIKTYGKNRRSLLGLGALWVLPTIVHTFVWLSYFIPRKLTGELWTAAVAFNGQYLRAGWAGNLSGQLIFIAILGISFLMFAGCVYFALKNARRANPLLTTTIASALLFSVILGTFYTHYFLIVTPYFCLGAGAYWRDVIKSRLWLSVAVVGIIGASLVSLRQVYNSFYGPAAQDAANMSEAASYVKSRTSAGDKIIFYGYGATFYRLAERDSGSRYISASHPLIDEREQFGYDFTGKYIGDIAESRPAYIIIDDSTRHIYDDNRLVMNYFNRRYKTEINIDGYEILKRRD